MDLFRATPIDICSSLPPADESSLAYLMHRFAVERAAADADDSYLAQGFMITALERVYAQLLKEGL